MSDINALVLQALERIEEKVDAQDEKITHATLGQRRLIEKMDIRIVKCEKDISFQQKVSGVLGAFVGTIGSWLFYHVSR